MQLDGEAVLLHLHSHGYFGLNATATEVWELVLAHPGIALPAIAAALGRRYGRDPTGITSDLSALLGEMVGESLVESCSLRPTAVIEIEPCELPYQVPRIEAFGELDTLILSGE